MISYGAYTESQQEALKKRNSKLIGKIRHYDEIYALGYKQRVIDGFIADRPFEKAIKKESFQAVDGSPWGWEDQLVEVVNLPFRLNKMRTDFPIDPAPPGYHLPQWTVEKSPDFVPIPKPSALASE
jgi:hypothetical protein